MLKKTIVSFLHLVLGISPILLPTLSIFMSPLAQAVNECGTGTTIICNNSGTPSTNGNPYRNGIRYTGSNINLTLTNGGMVNTTGGTASTTLSNTVAIGVGNVATDVSEQAIAGNASITVQSNASVTVAQNDIFGLVIRGATLSSLSTATILNAGNISLLGTGGRAIYAYTNGNENVTNNGNINGTGHYGIYAQDAGSGHNITINNGGIINLGSNWAGIQAATTGSGGSSTVNQTGTVISSGGVGVLFTSSVAAVSASLTNSGIIQGTTNGVAINNAKASITNSTTGNIQGTNGSGITTLANGTINLTNNGTIRGATGLTLSSSGNTINNFGTIQGTGGTAIQLSGNNNSLTLHNGSLLNGSIASTGSGNTLRLQGSGLDAYDILGISNLTMNGTDWLLAGTVTTNANTATATALQNGLLTVTGSLDNGQGAVTVANSATLQIGNGSNSGTLLGKAINNGTLIFNRLDESNYGGVLSGSGVVNQIGTGVLTLEGIDSNQSSVNVQQGTLRFIQNGAFTTIGDYTTQSGATTSIGQLNSTLNIGGVFTQAADSILEVTLGSPPDIIARSAVLNGSLRVNGFSYTPIPAKASDAIAQDYTLLRTTEGISGDFVNNLVAPYKIDYLLLNGYLANGDLDYNLGFRLAWTQGNASEANGSFTLSSNTGFDVDIALGNRSGVFSSGWNGQDLFKNGEGLLVLSAVNTYTGSTVINGGTLQTRIANAFTQSSAVTLGQGATFDLNGFDQLANNLSGAGDIQLGSAVLTINNTINTVLSGVISGSGSVVKNGDSTLVLTGANSYNGDTSLKQGRIDVGHNSALGNSALLMDDGTVLGFAADNLSIANNINLTGINDPVIDTGATRQTLSGVISGSGILSKEGSGTLIFTGTNTYSGATNINQGALQAGTVNTFSSFSNHNVAAGSLLNLAGFNQTLARLDNAGSVSLSGAPGTVLTVNGDYIGSNGILNFNTVLNDDSSATDKLIVNGNTSGSTLVSVTNAGGIGAATLNGIQLVQVNGLSDGEFVQNGRIVAGAYDYSLARGLGNNATNWYLTSTTQPTPPEPTPPEPTPPEPTPPEPTPMLERPEAGGYASNLSAANTLFVTRLHDRLGETQYIDALTGEQKVTSLWLRNQGGHNRSRYDDGQLSTQANRYVLQLGGDIAQWSNNGQDRWHLGAMAGYANNKSSTISRYSGYRANASIDGYSVGLYGTWYANQADKSGFYLDTWAQYSWFKNSVDGQQLSSEKYDANGFTASIESGYTFKLGENSAKNLSYFIQPQAQLVWMGVKADDHQEVNGTNVAGEGDGNIQSRLGVKAFIKGHSAQDEGKDRLFQPFVAANWIHNSKDFGATLNNYTVKQDGAANIAELTLGLEGQWNKNVNLWGNVGQQIGDKGYSDTSVMLGGKYLF